MPAGRWFTLPAAAASSVCFVLILGLLRSRDFVGSVMGDLKLFDDPEFNPALANAADIYSMMLKDKECAVILTLGYLLGSTLARFNLRRREERLASPAIVDGDRPV